MDLTVDFFLVYTLVMIISTFVVLGLMLYAVHTKLDELESYFKENAEVRKYQERWKRNQRLNRGNRMALLINVLRTPKRSVKEGLLTEAELAAIPPALKRWAVWPYRLVMVWAVGWGYWGTWL